MAAHLTRFLAALCLFSMVLVAPAQEKDAKKPEKKMKLAHIRLHGELDEAPTLSEPLFGSASENFKTKLERIAKASKDAEVAGILIHLDGITAGWAKIAELRKAIADARKAGKKVFAYLDDGTSRDFIVATEADIVAMPPGGELMIVGMRAEITFFKEMLEKLGIRADFLTMGVFKSAAEPYTRKDMSPEAKAQYKLVLDDFFEGIYVGSVVRSRGKKANLDAAKYMKIIDTAPHSARVCKQLGLIDHAVYEDEFRKIIEKDLGVGELKFVKNYASQEAADIDFSNPFAIFQLLSPKKSSGLTGKKDRIAIIYALGAIMTGKSGASILGGNTVGSTTLIEAIKQADADPKVKAIVLRVDSPGGSALASDLIWHQLKECKKPVIASMSDVAASGGYYISMAAKKIYADPGTLTGSIGVVGGKIAIRGLLEKAGVHTDGISRGANSGLLSMYDGFSTSERKAMQTMMEEIYDQFLTKAIAGRKEAGKEFSREKMLKLAEGRIWTGRQALEHGLIDALGGLEDAIGEAKVAGGLSRDAGVDYLVLPKATGFLDSLLDKNLGTHLRTMVLDQPELREHLRAIEPLLSSREHVWLLAPGALRVR
jgi:protease-4